MLPFTIKVHNGSQAGMVTVTDRLPRQTRLVFASGCTSTDNGDLDCTFPMFPYEQATAYVTVQVTPTRTAMPT